MRKQYIYRVLYNRKVPLVTRSNKPVSVAYPENGSETVELDVTFNVEK
jgi:hypothetical protein